MSFFCRHGTGRHLLVFQQTSNKPLASGHLNDIKMSRFEGRFPFASRVYGLFTLKNSLASCLRPIFEATRGGEWQGDFSPGSVFQRLLEFGAASFSVFLLCESLCITSITNPIHAVCFQCWTKHTKARWSRWQRAKKAITRSSITRTPR